MPTESGTAISKCLLQNASFLGQSGSRVRTKILDIFIPGYGQSTALLAICGTCARTKSFVDDDAICRCGSDKSCAVGEAGPARVRVEGDIGYAVTEGAEQKRQVPYKPPKSSNGQSKPNGMRCMRRMSLLQGLSEVHHSLA